MQLQSGSSAHMLKVGSKRRRPPAEVKAEQESKRAKDEGVQQQLAELQRFESHLKEEAKKLETARQAEGVLNELIRAGDVKQYGDGSWGAVQQGVDPESQ